MDQSDHRRSSSEELIELEVCEIKSICFDRAPTGCRFKRKAYRLLLVRSYLVWCADVILHWRQHMVRFVDDESKSKRGGQGMDVSQWPTFSYSNVPRQRNGKDCGEKAQR